MIERVCVNCAKWHIDYEPDYSDVTPGSGFSMWCEAQHYNISGQAIDSDEHFRGLILTARTCGEFDPCTVAEKEQRKPAEEPPLISSGEHFFPGGSVGGGAK